MDPAQVAPLAQPAAAAAPQVLPPPPPLPLALPAAPAPAAFALGRGRSHAVLNFGNPNTGAMTSKLYNKAIYHLSKISSMGKPTLWPYSL